MRVKSRKTRLVILIVIGCIAIAVPLIRISVMVRDGAASATLVVGSVTICGIALLIFVVLFLRRSRALASSHIRALDQVTVTNSPLLVLSCYATRRAGRKLQKVLRSSTLIGGTYFSVVVEREGLAFWHAEPEPEQIGHIAWAAIQGFSVHTETTPVGTSISTLLLELKNPDVSLGLFVNSVQHDRLKVFSNRELLDLAKTLGTARTADAAQD